MGIAINGPALVYRDNQSVLANTKGSDFSLEKNSNIIAFYFLHKVTARKKWRTTYINTSGNTSNMLTKPLPSREKWRKFGGRLLHHFCHAPVA